MAIINITIPFLLITWAEQSVESSLAAILTSPVPLFAIVLSAIFLADEPMRVNGVVGLIVGFIGVVIITSRGLTGAGSSVTGEIALLGAAFSYACGAVYSRRNVRGLAPMIPAVFQVTFAAIITGTIALLFEHPWTATPDAEAVFSILWLGILGSGLAYLAVFRLFAHWGATRTTLVAYLHPGRRDRARLPRPPGARRRADRVRDRARRSPASGWSTAGSAGAGCSVACRRSRRPSRSAPARSAADASSSAPPTIEHRRADPPHGLARGRPPRPSAPSPTPPRRPSPTRAAAPRPDSGATLSATRMHR